jgi:apolipoprotein N-acyltransferase
VLASQDFFTSPSRVLVVDVPTQGMSTVYGRLGDWFAWLCIAAMVALIVAAFRRSSAQNS